MTPSYHSESDQPQDGGLLPSAAVAAQKLEHVGPAWATSTDASEGIVWWQHECATGLEAFDQPDTTVDPMTMIVRLERADGVQSTFLPAGRGLPAARELVVEQGPDLVVIDCLRMGEQTFPELYLTLEQAEALGMALAVAVTVHRERQSDVFPDPIGSDPIAP